MKKYIIISFIAFISFTVKAQGVRIDASRAGLFLGTGGQPTLQYKQSNGTWISFFGLLQQGTTNDSIVTSNAGVLKRLSMSDVVKAGTNTQIATPLTGTTVTIASTTTRLLLQPASTLTTLTIAFPSSPIDGQTIRISVGSPAGITSGVTACPSVTYSNGTIFGTTPSTLTGGDTVDFQWDNASSVWRRIIL